MEEPAEESAHLLSFLYACPVGLLEISSDGTIDMMNPIAMQLLFRLCASPSANLFEMTSTHAPEFRNLLTDFKPAQGTVCENHRIFVRTGLQKEWEQEVLSCTLIKLERERYMVSLSDISNQVRQERKLKEAESWFASLTQGGAEFGLASLDAAGRIASVDASFAKQMGFEEKELVGESLDFLEATESSKDALTVEDQLASAAREGWCLHEDWHRHRDGSKGWYQRLIALSHEEAQRGEIFGYTVVLREGQQRSIDARQLKEMLTRDHLTGVYNRMHFFNLAERECIRKKRYQQPFSLVMVDIDFFKQVNDVHGHAMGDEVLKQFAQVCLSLLRGNDAVARIGGEEFAVLLPGTGLEGCKHFAERLRVAVSEGYVNAGNKRITITASLGCAELGAECNLAMLMADADAALYEAKHAGRNCVVAQDGSS